MKASLVCAWSWSLAGVLLACAAACNRSEPPAQQQLDGGKGNSQQVTARGGSGRSPGRDGAARALPAAASPGARATSSGGKPAVSAESSDAEVRGRAVPDAWVGSWFTRHTTYFSLLGVSGSLPVTGRSVCLVINRDGRFSAELGEYALAAGMAPCGSQRRCSLEGEIQAVNRTWRITEKKRSCRLPEALPRTFGARIRVVDRFLKLQLEDRGLFGALHDFALRPGPCPPTTPSFPACPSFGKGPGQSDGIGF